MKLKPLLQPSAQSKFAHYILCQAVTVQGRTQDLRIGDALHESVDFSSA